MRAAPASPAKLSRTTTTATHAPKPISVPTQRNENITKRATRRGGGGRLPSPSSCGCSNVSSACCRCCPTEASPWPLVLFPNDIDVFALAFALSPPAAVSFCPGALRLPTGAVMVGGKPCSRSRSPAVYCFVFSNNAFPQRSGGDAGAVSSSLFFHGPAALESSLSARLRRSPDCCSLGACSSSVPPEVTMDQHATKY